MCDFPISSYCDGSCGADDEPVTRPQPTPRKRWLSDREYVIEDEQPTASAGEVEALAVCRHCAQLIRDKGNGWVHGERGSFFYRCQRTANYGTDAEPVDNADWLATLLADVRREERERAWDEGWNAGNTQTDPSVPVYADNPYRREARGGAR